MTTSARHNPWETIFQTDERILSEPHPMVVRFAEDLRDLRGRMLDLGCGTGRHLRIFAERGYDVVGLDASPTALAMARHDVPSAELLEGDLFEPLPFADGEFSVVVACQSLHHGTSRMVGSALAEAARSLARDGWLYLSVPTRRNQAQRFTQLEPDTWLPLDGPEEGLPHHFFDAGRLSDRLREVGLHVHSLELDGTQHLCVRARHRAEPPA